MVLLLAVLAAALPLSGCGDFWQAPGSSGSTGTTATTTTLTTPNSTTTTGTSVTLTATVSPSAATGTVTFYNNSVSLGEPATLTSGTATFNATFSTAGTESLTATYDGSSTYAESTSSAVTVTVTAASSTARTQPITPVGTLTNTAYGSSPLHAISDFSTNGGAYTARDSQAAVVESGGSINLTGTMLSGAAGSGSGVLLSSSTSNPALSAPARFTMSGGSLTYNCSATQTDSCDQGTASRAQSAAATLFSVAGTKAAIALTDVTVANHTATSASRQGTLLTVGTSSAASSSSGNATFAAHGTTLTGDVLVAAASSAALSLLTDDAGSGSSLTGAINSANASRAVSLALDESSTWTVTGTSYLSSLAGLDLNGATVNNIDGGGHCVYYSGTVNGSGSVVYTLSGGGFLAPAGTSGLACH